ncbi:MULTISPECIES: branched-chain amino acid ABC transporter permease [unclassified Nocardioides]|uniref:branched-chain amino acid ABC transporter permease n=1 Tax=unclassified Nocardioides TaxID=2615069 RepID=UPI0006F43F65|nr:MULTISPECIES: branched-chain amino acid ABC transporter permease [unclassified Nocardioides]KRA29834.1 hypothetical protein ASD81_19160 [Nocardioides sp. Root614]KRA86757.1 hypothetical protein ASD84_21385 [Nocardioides sp. Root682]
MAIEWIDAVTALRVGIVYALLALAYFLFARTTDTINFAVGGYAMAAAMLYATLTGGGTSPLVAFVVAVGLGAVLGGMTETFVIRPIASKGRDEFVVVLAITALLFVIQQLAGFVFGRRAIIGEPLTAGRVELAGYEVSFQNLLTIAVGFVAAVVVGLWIGRGRSGRMMRAIGDNEQAGLTLGIPVRRVRLIAASVGGLLAGLAGALTAPQAGNSFHSGVSLSIVGFIALVIGGMGSAYAPLIGGVLLSFLELGTSLIFGSTSRDYFLLAAVLLVFIARPEGLFSLKVRTT